MIRQWKYKTVQPHCLETRLQDYMHIWKSFFLFPEQNICCGHSKEGEKVLMSIQNKCFDWQREIRKNRNRALKRFAYLYEFCSAAIPRYVFVIGEDKLQFQCKYMVNFKSINFNMCFGCSKDLSHWVPTFVSVEKNKIHRVKFTRVLLPMEWQKCYATSS